jgi:hypothetical protein
MRPTTRDLKGGGRVVRGTVASTGAIIDGTGFAVIRSALGQFIVTFATPFTAIPIITASVAENVAKFVVVSPSASAPIFLIRIPNTLADSDAAFSFTAMEEDR